MSTVLTADFSFTSSEDENEEPVTVKVPKMNIKKEKSTDGGEGEDSTGEDSEIEEVDLTAEDEDEEREIGRSGQDQERNDAESSSWGTGADLFSGVSMEGLVRGTVAGAALTTEVSERVRTRASSKKGRRPAARSVATNPSLVSLFQDHEQEFSDSGGASAAGSKSSRDHDPEAHDHAAADSDTETDADERNLGATSARSVFSSQKSRTDGAAASATTGEENITLSYLKNGDLALVWYVGNEEFSSFTSKKVKKVRRATIDVDLLELCERVETVYPKMMRAVRTQRTTRTNIRLTHIGVLLKGLMIIYRTQMQELKKTFLIEYSKLKNPVQMAIDLPKEPTAKNKRPKKHDGIEIDAADLTFGVFHVKADPSDSELRVACGGGFLDEAGDNVPSKSKKTKKQRKQKQVQEQDIMKLLEQHADELQQNGATYTLPGAGIDLPEPPAAGDITNLLDSCHMFDILAPETRSEIEKAAQAQKEANEKSPPSSLVNGKRNNNEAIPVAPRKRARVESPDSENNLSSFELSTLSEDTEISARRRRRLIFNRVDKNPTITLRTLVKGQKAANAEEQRRLLDERIAQTLSALSFTGLNLIANSGRKIANENLQALVKQSLPKPAELLRHNAKKRKRQETGTDLEIEEERTRAEEDRDLLGFVDGAVDADAEIPRGNLPMPTLDDNENFNMPFMDAELMEPMQAESIINSEGTPEKMEAGHGHGREQDRINARPRKTFTQIVGANANKMKAAHTFAVLLKMQAQRKIQLSQDEPYAEISVQQLGKK